MLSDRGLCDELITRPEESYRLCCVVVCDLETSRIGAAYIYIYIYDINNLRVNQGIIDLSESFVLTNLIEHRMSKAFNILMPVYRFICGEIVTSFYHNLGFNR